MKPKNKKIVNSILSFVLVVCALMSGGLATVGSVIANSIVASAAGATIVESGNCGENGSNITYTLDSEGTLTIWGSGYMIMDKSPFKNNENIKNVIIKKGITSIGLNEFYGCKSLINIIIPDSVTYIGSDAFYGCASLKNISISDKVTFIGPAAFLYCDNLININVGKDNKFYLSENGVLFDKKRTEIICFPQGKKGVYNIPYGVKKICELAFYNCVNLTDVTIPDSVTFIGESSFYCCKNLISLEIPDNVTSIGAHAFLYCSSLASITVGKNNMSYLSDNGVLFNKKKTELIYCIPTKKGKYDIPSGVLSVHARAFQGCVNLSEIMISDYVASLGEFVFEDCKNLTEISVDSSNKYYSSVDGVLFNKSRSKLIFYPMGNINSFYTIPNYVTSIEDFAFDNCINLRNVKIPDSIVSIGVGAFGDCKNLNNIIIPNSVMTIDVGAFEACESITKVIIYSGIISIGNYVFQDCTNLTDVYYSGSKEDWEKIKIGNYGNNQFLASSIHFNYGKLSVITDLNDYRLYYSENVIVPGKTFEVGADNWHGYYLDGHEHYLGVYYPGPGKVEWEVTAPSVLELLTSYDDRTYAKFKVNEFGKCDIICKLNGEIICKETVNIVLASDKILSDYMENIFSTNVIVTLQNGVKSGKAIMNNYSESDEKLVALMTALEENLGLGVIRKWALSSIGIASSVQEDAADDVVMNMMLEYLSTEEFLGGVVSDIKEKYGTFSNLIEPYRIAYSYSEKDFKKLAKQLGEKSSFTENQILELFSKSQKFVKTGLELAELVTTCVTLAQIDRDSVCNLIWAIEMGGGKDSEVAKAAHRLLLKIDDVETYVVDKYLSDKVINELLDLAEELTTPTLFKGAKVVADFLTAIYSIQGGKMADDFIKAYTAMDIASYTKFGLKNTANDSYAKLFFGFYKAAVKNFINYCIKLADIKDFNYTNKEKFGSLKSNAELHSDLIENFCTYEQMMSEAELLSKGEYLEEYYNIQKYGLATKYNPQTAKFEVVKTTSSSANNSGKSVLNKEDYIFVPLFIDDYKIISIADHGFEGIKNKSGIILPDTIESLGEYSFADSDFESAVLNTSLQDIGNYAFYNCTLLDTVNIPENVKNIGECAFKNCSEISYLTINADTIGESAFENCTSLFEVRILNKNAVIGKQAFLNCSDDFQLSGYKGSTAEKYAEENNIAFVAITEYVESIDVVTSADKTVYEVGEEIDTSGLSLKVKYKDGSEEIVNNGWMVTYDTSSVGEKQVNIIYGEKNISYQITVNQGELPKLSLNYSNLDVLYGTGIQLVANLQTKSDYKPAVVFESSNPKIVKVSSTGYVSALNPGKAVITAKIMNTNVTAECAVNAVDTVKIDGDTEPQYIVFTPSEDNYYIFTTSESDDNVKLDIYDNGSVYAEQEDEKISLKSVLAKDIAYILKVETAHEIDLKIRGCEPVSEISIADEDGNEVTNVSGNIGTSVRLQLKIYADNSMEEGFYWSSSDSDIAEVDETGKAELKNSGKAVITIRTAHNIQAECEFIVTKNGIFGDTNGDESVDIADALMIARYDAGLIQLYETQLSVSDVNKDDSVNIADALMVARYDAGLIRSL